MPDIDLRLDHRALAALGWEPGVRREVHRAGRGMANLADRGAPNETGLLDLEIDSRPSASAKQAVGYTEDISWTDRAYYGIFHNDGTKYVPARRFLEYAFRTYSLR